MEDSPGANSPSQRDIVKVTICGGWIVSARVDDIMSAGSAGCGTGAASVVAGGDDRRRKGKALASTDFGLGSGSPGSGSMAC